MGTHASRVRGAAPATRAGLQARQKADTLLALAQAGAHCSMRSSEKCSEEMGNG